MALGEQLETLGSELKSQIMSDLNSWEDRRRSEAQSGRSGKKAAKRARPQPLPEVPHGMLVALRQMQYELFTDTGAAARQISEWAVGVLSVFVSVADMKGNCRLGDLIGLPGAKAVFQLLVLAVESSYSQVGVAAGETAFIDTVVSTTRDPRAVAWILNQYGAAHSAQFPQSLHMFAVSRLAQGGGPGGLAAAIGELAGSHPEQNRRALDGLLDVYRQAVAGSGGGGGQIGEDDPRRFVLFYLLQTQAVQLHGGRGAWLGEAIRFEMRTGFSRFLVQRDEATRAQPLAASIEVLYGDHGAARRASDAPLDIGRVLGVFELIALVTGDAANGLARGEAAGAEDVEMADAGGDRPSRAFADACMQTLRRLVRREQELAVLAQLPRAVKQMPQPIMNGLQEAVQRGARAHNNGPVAHAAASADEAAALCARLFALLGSAGSARRLGARLHGQLCGVAPALVEILGARMDAAAAPRALVRTLVDGWPLRAAPALFRALLAVGEPSRGVLLPQLLHAFAAGLRAEPSPARVQHMVGVLAGAVARHARIAAGAEPRLAAEPVADLCGVLAVNWRALWARCFARPGAWPVRTALVRALVQLVQLRAALRVVDRVALLEHALRELAALQRAMAGAPPRDAGEVAALARALLALVGGLQGAGFERLALERLLLQLLAWPPAEDTARGARGEASSDGVLPLETVLAGRLLPLETAPAGRLPPPEAALAAQMLWQNAVRPLPKYPRSGLRRHDRSDDAWAFAAHRTRLGSALPPPPARGRPLLVCAVRLLVHGSAAATAALAQLLEEFYVDSLPSMPPALLDARLDGARLQLRGAELELLQDARRNRDLERVLAALARDAPHGAQAARRLIGALVVALVVFWRGALHEPAARRPDDLAFTTRLAALAVDAYAPRDAREPSICPLFALLAGRELAQLLHHYVWRWVLHRMPGARDESRRVIRHIMRRHIVAAAPLFKSIYPFAS
ncbi:hypothetical protein IWW54_003899 [Coemansia sp. RSA 2705]|nr:hypothetical protein IWW54_003899 [Coemansia sp. RSA 2705]